MTNSTRVVAARVIGASIGGMAGYLFLTERGRRVREQLEPTMDEFVRETARFRSAVHKARLAAREAWGTLGDLAEPAHASDWPEQRRQASRFDARLARVLEGSMSEPAERSIQAAWNC